MPNQICISPKTKSPIFFILGFVFILPSYALAQNEKPKDCRWEIHVGGTGAYTDFSSFSNLFNANFEHDYSFRPELMAGSNLGFSVSLNRLALTVGIEKLYLKKSEGLLEAEFQNAGGYLWVSYDFPLKKFVIRPIVGMSHNFSRSNFSSSSFGGNPSISGLANSYQIDWETWQIDFGLYVGTYFRLRELGNNQRINLGLRFIQMENVHSNKPLDSNGNSVVGVNELNTSRTNLSFIIGIPLNFMSP